MAKRISISSAKAKGRRLQNKVRDKILELFPHLEADDVKSCTMGDNGEDILLSPAARAVMPFSIECKARQSFAVYAFVDQAAKYNKGEPLVVLQGDRRKPLAVVDLDLFLGLIAELGRG